MHLDHLFQHTFKKFYRIYFLLPKTDINQLREILSISDWEKKKNWLGYLTVYKELAKKNIQVWYVLPANTCSDFYEGKIYLYCWCSNSWSILVWWWANSYRCRIVEWIFVNTFLVLLLFESVHVNLCIRFCLENYFGQCPKRWTSIRWLAVLRWKHFDNFQERLE